MKLLILQQKGKFALFQGDREQFVERYQNLVFGFSNQLSENNYWGLLKNFQNISNNFKFVHLY